MSEEVGLETEVVEKKSSFSNKQQLETVQPVVDPPGPTVIATRVNSLKSSILSTVAKRNSLPQTLFWSLIRAEVDAIKKKKARERIHRAISQGM